MRRLIVVVTLMLAACTTPVIQADVTRFHALGLAPTPGSFTIVPDSTQVGSLEFQDYAAQVADALAAKGWRPVAPGKGGADALVAIHWGIGAPNTMTWQSPSSVYSGVGWGPRSAWYGGGFYDPFPYWETRSVTTYPRWLSVEMSDAHSAGRKVLFEGRAVAEGSSREIAPVMPYLVKALFTGFPGSTGTTVRVEVPTKPR
jgi:hypothetical protein